MVEYDREHDAAKKTRHYRGRDGEDHEDRRERPVAAVEIWGRKYPVNAKNILFGIAIISAAGSGIGWLLNRFVFPWPSRDEVAASIKEVNSAIEVVQTEHDATRNLVGQTRGEVAALAEEQRLTNYVLCVSLRRSMPDLLPERCTQTIRSQQPTQRGRNGAFSPDSTRSQ